MSKHITFKDIPTHIAIIPDGNRRWARKRNLPTFEGHRIASEKTLPDLIKKAADLGVKYFTFWALSTENIAERTSQEIKHLFVLIRLALHKRLNQFKKKGVQIKVIGNMHGLPEDIKNDINKAVKETKENNRIILILAVNYGGRDEIIRAINKVQKLRLPTIDKNNFNSCLDTAGIPDPDLIIRTGGEKRLSGFMLWQSQYSELYFSDRYFPDFGPADLEESINEYSRRQRRFGK